VRSASKLKLPAAAASIPRDASKPAPAPETPARLGGTHGLAAFPTEDPPGLRLAEKGNPFQLSGLQGHLDKVSQRRYRISAWPLHRTPPSWTELRAVRPAFLPSQVPRSDPECGERKLLFAVLADAFDDLRRAPRRSDATLAWFSCPDSGVLTLAAICDALGFTLAGVQTAAFKLHRLAHPPRH
jgi:hypothetical protein